MPGELPVPPFAASRSSRDFMARVRRCSARLGFEPGRWSGVGPDANGAGMEGRETAVCCARLGGTSTLTTDHVARDTASMVGWRELKNMDAKAKASLASPIEA